MIREHFRFARPATLDEATALLASSGGGAKILGGGSVLVSGLSSGLETPDLVLDPVLLGLDRIVDTEDAIKIGARVTYAALARSEATRARLPLLSAMVREVTGGPGLWNLATLGGAACYANPASDGPGCLSALAASFRLVSIRGTRLVPAEAFFQGAFSTACAADEMLTEIVIPAAGSAGSCAYIKVKHSASSWPIVTASSLIVSGPDGHHVRACLGGAAPVPIVGEWTVPDGGDPDWIARCSQELAARIDPEWTDELAGPGYRRAIAATVVARSIRQTVEAGR